MKKIWNSIGTVEKIGLAIGSLGIIIGGGALMMKSFVKKPLVETHDTYEDEYVEPRDFLIEQE